MTERMSTWSPTDMAARGVPTKGLITLYRHWATAGYGILLTGDILVHPEQLEATGNAVIAGGAPFCGARFEAFAEWAAAAKSGGSLAVAQISHAGRQVPSAAQADPVSASDV